MRREANAQLAYINACMGSKYHISFKLATQGLSSAEFLQRSWLTKAARDISELQFIRENVNLTTQGIRGPFVSSTTKKKIHPNKHV